MLDAALAILRLDARGIDALEAIALGAPTLLSEPADQVLEVIRQVRAIAGSAAPTASTTPPPTAVIAKPAKPAPVGKHHPPTDVLQAALEVAQADPTKPGARIVPGWLLLHCEKCGGSYQHPHSRKPTTRCHGCLNAHGRARRVGVFASALASLPTPV